MRSSLLAGLDEKDKTEVKQSYLSGQAYRKRVVAMIEADKAKIIQEMTTSEVSNSPNWALDQAMKIAQLKEMQNLLKFLE